MNENVPPVLHELKAINARAGERARQFATWEGNADQQFLPTVTLGSRLESRQEAFVSPEDEELRQLQQR